MRLQDASEKQKQELVDNLFNLKNTCSDTVVDITGGVNEADRSKSYNYAFTIRIKDRESLPIYLKCDAHVDFKQKYLAVRGFNNIDIILVSNEPPSLQHVLF